MVPAILVMGIGPLLGWGKDEKLNFLKKILPPAVITTIITISMFIVYKSFSLIGVIGIVLSFWIISNNFLILIKKYKKNPLSMIVAHIGIGLLILGITGSSVWQEEKIIRMKINSETKIEKYSIFFKQIDEVKGSNYVAIRANFDVYNKKQNIVANLSPENRYYPITKNFTTEASIHTNLLRDLYIVLGDGNLNDGWIVRIYYNPLVIWIWIGAAIIFLGGIISLQNNIKKLKFFK
tara:strand:- start:1121 stop:1828 length:708 start_codon:yes stop_codon:yes gene_type:complete